MPVDEVSAPALSERIAEFAIEEAIAEAGIGRPGDFPGPMFLALPPVELEWSQRIALATASGANESVTYDDLLRAAGTGEFSRYYERFLFGSVAEALADRFGTKGSPVATSTACASGATAIQLGVEAIRRGEAEAALVIGTDASVNPESLIRFSLLSALSTRNDPPAAAARPFSKDRDGFVMAEGAGALVLESRAHARARGAKIIGVVEGCGEMADGFHRTRSSPDGKPIIACMQQALDDAGLAPDAIGYINAHGTGTPENDKMEWVGASAVFGARAGVDPDLVQQVDDRPHADRGRRGGGDLHPARAAARQAAADHQLRDAGPDAAGGLRAERRARCAGGACDFEFVRLRRAERLSGPGHAGMNAPSRTHLPRCGRGRHASAWWERSPGIGSARHTLSRAARAARPRFKPGARLAPALRERCALMTARALVIGGRRGIGAAVVQALTAKGMEVTYTYRTAPGQSAAAARQLDLADRAAVEAFAQGAGKRRRPGTRWCRSAAPPTTRWRP